MSDPVRPYQTYLESLPEALLILDLTRRQFVVANAAAGRLLGCGSDDIVGSSPADFVSPAEYRRLALAYDQVTLGITTRREWIIRPKSGATIPVCVTSTPILVDGRTHIIMIVHDLSLSGPIAQQRLVLGLASERLAASLEFDETLRASVALVTPHIADACWISVCDPGTGWRQCVYGTSDAATGDVAVTVVPPAPATPPAWAGAPDGRGDGVPADATCATFPLQAHERDIGTLTMRRDPSRHWTPDARSVATALARRIAQAVDSALLWRTAQRELARRAAILRISRVFAESEPGSDRVMHVLMDEAMTLVGGDHGGISLWDAPAGRLVQVFSTSGRSNGMVLKLENSLSGRAAIERRPVISNTYQQEFGRNTPAGRFGERAGIAAPLMHEGLLLGVLSVGTRAEGVQFEQDDVDAVELLAGMAASMLGTLERAQLQAVTLASRELAHRLNNDLALAVGIMDLLSEEPSLSPEMRAMVADAAGGLQHVTEQLTMLQRLARFQTRETPVGRALDLDRSTHPHPNPAPPDHH